MHITLLAVIGMVLSELGILNTPMLRVFPTGFPCGDYVYNKLSLKKNNTVINDESLVQKMPSGRRPIDNYADTKYPWVQAERTSQTPAKALLPCGRRFLSIEIIAVS